MVIPGLRIESRRKYLEKIKDDKVTEFEANIIDYIQYAWNLLQNLFVISAFL